MAIDKQELKYVFLEKTTSTSGINLDIDITDLPAIHDDGYGFNLVALVDLMVHHSVTSNIQFYRGVARWKRGTSSLINANDGGAPTTLHTVGSPTYAGITQPTPPNANTLRLVLTPSTTSSLSLLVKITLNVWDGAA